MDNYVMRESPLDIQRKKNAMNQYAQYLNDMTGQAGWRYSHLYEQKYKLDCALYFRKKLKAFVEYKYSTWEDGCVLNVSKLQAGINLSKAAKTRFILVANLNDYYIGSCILAFNGVQANKLEIIEIEDKRAGHNNPDDKEPCALIPWDLFKAFKT